MKLCEAPVRVKLTRAPVAALHHRRQRPGGRVPDGPVPVRQARGHGVDGAQVPAGHETREGRHLETHGERVRKTLFDTIYRVYKTLCDTIDRKGTVNSQK